MSLIGNERLYLVISEEYAKGRKSDEVAACAIAGGVDMIQMREKSKSAVELMQLGAILLGIARRTNTKFIVNDDPDLALGLGADGVHLGQDDICKFTLSATRRKLGRDKIIGISTHSVDQLREANESDVDYIAYGPVFETKTKNYFIGISGIKEILKAAKKPVFFIGGINLLNIDKVMKEGAGRISVIRGITEAPDIENAARAFKDKLDQHTREDDI